MNHLIIYVYMFIYFISFVSCMCELRLETQVWITLKFWLLCNIDYWWTWVLRVGGMSFIGLLSKRQQFDKKRLLTDPLKDCKIHYLEQLCYKIFGWQIVVDSRRISLFVKCGQKEQFIYRTLRVRLVRYLFSSDHSSIVGMRTEWVAPTPIAMCGRQI